VAGFSTYGRLAAPTLHNEAESGSLVLRLPAFDCYLLLSVFCSPYPRPVVPNPQPLFFRLVFSPRKVYTNPEMTAGKPHTSRKLRCMRHARKQHHEPRLLYGAGIGRGLSGCID